MHHYPPKTLAEALACQKQLRREERYILSKLRRIAENRHECRMQIKELARLMQEALALVIIPADGQDCQTAASSTDASEETATTTRATSLPKPEKD